MYVIRIYSDSQWFCRFWTRPAVYWLKYWNRLIVNLRSNLHSISSVKPRFWTNGLTLKRMKPAVQRFGISLRLQRCMSYVIIACVSTAMLDNRILVYRSVLSKFRFCWRCFWGWKSNVQTVASFSTVPTRSFSWPALYRSDSSSCKLALTWSVACFLVILCENRILFSVCFSVWDAFFLILCA